MRPSKFLIIGLTVVSLVVAFFALNPRLRNKLYRQQYDLSDYRRVGGFNPEHGKIKNAGLPNILLLDQNNEAQELYRYRHARGIIFYTLHPDDAYSIVRANDLRAIKEKFKARGIWVLFVHTGPGDPKRIKAVVDSLAINEPALIDSAYLLSERIGFERYGEAALVDTKNWKVVYRGKIHDGRRTVAPKRLFLEDSIVALLAGNAPPPERGPPPIGARISYPPRETLTFNEHIFPILKERCLNCHSKRHTPFFHSYESVFGWQEMIRETVLNGRMPPWGVLSRPGQFRFDYTLPPREARRLVSWAEQGAPRGAGADPLKAHQQELSLKVNKEQELQLDKTQIYEASMAEEVKVPPKGFTEYQYYQLGGPAPRDMWVSRVVLDSSNIRTIHHNMLIVTSEPLSFYVEKARSRRDEKTVSQDMAGNVPIWTLYEINYHENRVKQSGYYIRTQIYNLGKSPVLNYLPGTAIFIPKGAYILLENHYHGTGKEERERSTLRFYEYKGKKPPKQLKSIMAHTNYLMIPPGVSRFQVVTDPLIIKQDLYILSGVPHMHMRGRSFHLEATYPNGKVEDIFYVYNFLYTYSAGNTLVPKEPKFIPKGTRIRARCTFDNSPENPFNPNSEVTVYWGQTLDRSEMCLGQFMYYEK